MLKKEKREVKTSKPHREPKSIIQSCCEIKKLSNKVREDFHVNFKTRFKLKEEKIEAKTSNLHQEPQNKLCCVIKK